MYKFREGSIDYFVGIGLGLLLGVSIVVTSIWMPSVWAKENQWLVRLFFFSAGLFSILIGTNWRFRNRRRLWIAISILVTINSILILEFINQVRELTIRQYMLILFVETFVGIIALTKVLDGSDEAAK
jgi:hypothetical protein